MRSLDKRLLDTVTDERRRLLSRRRLLASGATIAGGGALALAAGPVPGSVGRALAQDFTDDLEILNYALTLEHLEYAFYRDGLDALGAEGFAEAGRDDDLFGRLEEIRDHEQAHVEALTQTIGDLGGTPVQEADYDFGYDDAASFLEVAMALENTGVAAYAGAAPSIADGAILATALGIHSVEARHAAYLNDQNERSPFPNAVDEALTPDEVLSIAGPLIVGNDEATPGTADASGAEGAEVTVTIEGLRFLPDEIEVAVGTVVTWTNQEILRHTATAEDGTFESGDLGDGESFSHTFDTSGSYPYICEYHSNMRGTVIVT